MRQKSSWIKNIEVKLMREMERLSKKYSRGPKAHLLNQEGVSLASLMLEKKSFVRAIEKDLRSGVYRLSPATSRIAMLDKERTLYQFELSDSLVHGAFAEILREKLETQFSKHLYSYRAGSSQKTAMNAFSSFLKTYRESRPDPKTRGLYVLRRDVRKYTDTIPLHDLSPLWKSLKEASGDLPDYEWALLQEMVQPRVWSEEKTSSRPLSIGLPTGSAITTAIANLYLAPLDQALSNIEGGFYARFGDDFIFAHENEAAARLANEKIKTVLKSLELSIHPDKEKNFWFTASGCRNDFASDFVPAQEIDYLGMSLHFRGTIRISQEKIRELRLDINERLQRTAQLLRAEKIAGPEFIRALVQTANESIRPNGEWTHPRITELFSMLEDRGQLRDFDYRIALKLVETVTGFVGPKAFRKISYRKLRREHGLLSLLHLLNLGNT